MYIWQGPDRAWGHVRLEALLSSRTIYGNSKDVEHLHREALVFLKEGLKRLNLIAEAVGKLRIRLSVCAHTKYLSTSSQVGSTGRLVYTSLNMVVSGVTEVMENEVTEVWGEVSGLRMILC